jgi:uroporphyrin-III C-methyltransferase|tara:strand:+ start:250 stop:996 length:747 start_codon:yes stop_codon:yes gene_type:complete
MVITMNKVFLVGSGPGDPELITLKGLNLIKKADIIIYDRLASGDLLKFARNDAELIYCGKKSGEHSYSQDEINKLLIEKASDGKTIVRLKGGDPFVFGRGGEEAKALINSGLRFEVVPGITSAIAVPAAANIPVTDRHCASSFAVVTGQEDPKKEEKIDYGALGADTVIVLMGINNLKNIANQMLKTRSKDTPVAIIEQGTTANQRVITCPLGDVVEKATQTKVKPPAIIVIGSVVGIRETLSVIPKC